MEHALVAPPDIPCFDGARDLGSEQSLNYESRVVIVQYVATCTCSVSAGPSPVRHPDCARAAAKLLQRAYVPLLTAVQACGTSKVALETAYKAAANAAAQLGPAQKPFLITATQDPVFSRHGYRVMTHPLGYRRPLETEQVRLKPASHTSVLSGNEHMQI